MDPEPDHILPESHPILTHNFLIPKIIDYKVYVLNIFFKYHIKILKQLYQHKQRWLLLQMAQPYKYTTY